MPHEKPDMDLLALAALTKGDLRGIDQVSTGGNSRADKIDIQKLAGVAPQRPQSQQRGYQQPQPQRHPVQPQRGPVQPNILKGFDFLEMPKSRPLGQVDMDGLDLPPMPLNNKIEFAPIPEDIRDNVLHHAETVDRNPYAHHNNTPIAKVPTVDMDFDLFQYTMLKDMIDKLDISIKSMVEATEHLKEKREMIMTAIRGNKNEK